MCAASDGHRYGIETTWIICWSTLAPLAVDAPLTFRTSPFKRFTTR
jgi:hypothetical protein